MDDSQQAAREGNLDEQVHDGAPRLRELAKHLLRLDERQLLKGVEPGDADADEPQGARPLAQRTVEQTAGERSDRVGVVDSGPQRRRAAADREVRVAELRRDGSRAVAAPLQTL